MAAGAQRQPPPLETTQVPLPSTGRMFRPIESIPRIAASSTVGPSGGIGLRAFFADDGESAGAGREWWRSVVLLDGDVQRAPAALSAAANNSSPRVRSSSRRMRR
jgi:hypothetical protein